MFKGSDSLKRYAETQLCGDEEEALKEVGVPLLSEYVLPEFRNEFIRIMNMMPLDYEGTFKSLVNYLACGGNINVISAVGETFLHKACRYGYLEQVQYLLEQGAHVNIASVCNSSSQHIACVCGFTDIARAQLGAKAHPHPQDNEKMTPQFAAITHNYIDTAELLLQQAGVGSLPAQFFAAGIGSVQAVPLIQEYKADVNQVYAHHTPLHVAIERGYQPSVQALLDCGADPNVQNTRTSVFPLQLAIRTARPDVCALLLQHGASLSGRTQIDQTYLQLAAEIGSRKILHIVMPLTSTHLFSHADQREQTVLHSLAQKPSIEDILDNVLKTYMQYLES